MSYSDMTLAQVYEVTRAGSSTANPVQAAMGFLEAENIMYVRVLICDWFNWMQSGEAENHHPDPKWEPVGKRVPLTQEVADKIIDEMDSDFETEKARFPDPSDLNTGPCFRRLPQHARRAFAQQFYNLVKTEEELEREATIRVKRGEKFPPSGYETLTYGDFI